MKKSVLILCAVGFVFLVVGSVLTVVAPFENSKTISNFGTIGPSPEESQSTQASELKLDKLGYVTLLASVGFFGAAFLHGRKSSA